MPLPPKNYQLTVPKEAILNDCMPMPIINNLIMSLCEEREEALLAVMAAGVPASCISLTGPEIKTVNFRSQMLGIGFEFVRTI